MIQNEVFVKPAKVRGVIPVIDNVGVVESGISSRSCSDITWSLVQSSFFIIASDSDSDGDYEKESGSSHILPVSPEKQNKKGKSKRKKGKKKHQSIKSKKIKIEQ